MGEQRGKQEIGVAGVSGGNVSDGKKQSKAALLRLQHLQKLAIWTSRDAAVPSLCAFFGNRIAALQEAIGVQPDESLFTCERCETVLHPGNNCTVRIARSRSRKRHKHEGSKVPTQNNVVYKCHFCSYQTVKWGTLVRHMKHICPSKDKLATRPKLSAAKLSRNVDTESCTRDSGNTLTTPNNLVTESCNGNGSNASSAVEVAAIENVDSISVSETPAPVSPNVGTGRKLLDIKKRVRNKSASKKEPNSTSAKTDEIGINSNSKKRRRQTTTSLKYLVKSTWGSSRSEVQNPIGALDGQGNQ